jgi:4'-phosphopantetheinyl transferase EntD
MASADETLRRRLVGLGAGQEPQVRVGCRRILAGVERSLTPVEEASLAGCAVKVKRASAAARLVARELLRGAGAVGACDLPRRRGAAPVWPEGFTGSLSHDDDYAAAAIAPTGAALSIGIDIEPALPLPAGLLEVVATPGERKQIAGDALMARALFCMKEAVFKATYPLDGAFLDHHDVEIHVDGLTAETCTGRRLNVRLLTIPRLVALVVIGPEPRATL